MFEKDSRNGIEHKCPCCGYEVEWDYDEGYIKGDESFIQISPNFVSGNRKITNTFDTDRTRKVDWGLPDTEKVILLGCPKCLVISFKID